MGKKSSHPKNKSVEALTHEEAKRKNIPTAEYQSVLQKAEQDPIRVTYKREAGGLDEEKKDRNRDLDPQLVWHGKDEQDWSDLVVQAPPLYIQEKVHPKALIDDLLRETRERAHETGQHTPDLFADFNGIPKGVDKTEFYQHDQNWSNRMILGDSLQVMGSLTEREGLRGRVQCIYFDPPYGIKFNSNFQWSTTDKGGTTADSSEKISREPEQVKAFRDTWRAGIHSYLTYLRDRLTVARDLLTASGSIFVQIGDENVHRVRAVMDEVFGEDNFVALIPFRKKTMPFGSKFIEQMADFILWYAKSKTDSKGNANAKYRKQFSLRSVEGEFHHCWYEDGDGVRTRMSKHQLYNHALLPPKSRVYRLKSLEPSGRMDSGMFNYEFRGKLYHHPKNGFGTTQAGLKQIEKSNRLEPEGNRLCYVLYAEEGESSQMTAPWSDTVGADDKQYVVQTNTEVVKRCILMTTDPGDLVLDPTCGSGTTATVSEQWGRRWITIDTSRVALALARARIMGARYPFYLLADSRDGQIKEAEVMRTAPSSQPTRGNIRHGFVYERMPRITLGGIANNAEIDLIWEKWQSKLELLLGALNATLKKTWHEWEIPRKADSEWTVEAKRLFDELWETRIVRQKEIDASIAANSEPTYLYDKPYDDKKTVRVAGPFTVESLSPHRVLGVDENDELIDMSKESSPEYGAKQSFPQMILENLKTSGVQQAHKENKITFTALIPWPGDLVCAEGRYLKSEAEKRAAIFIGPEFGTVQRADLVAAAREAGDADFDVLIACAFNYEAHTTEFNKLGRIPVLKARMNADLHMADDLKNTGKGNLFVIFGEPDIEVASEEWLVDSSGGRIAPYEIFKLVSGVDSLAEVNRLKREHLHDYARLSCRREIWDYLADASRSFVHPREHCGRASQEDNRGVSAVAWHCAGIAGGVGNILGSLRETGLPQSAGFRKLLETLRGDQQDVKQSHEISLHSPLATLHYSQVTVHGVDVFKPQTGEVISDGAEGIACWFIDTDYNEESFFVRHAYFLGANDPYSSLKTTLKAEIDQDAWATLNSDTSRAFEKPESGRIAVKVINHLGDEVMKVFKIN